MQFKSLFFIFSFIVSSVHAGTQVENTKIKEISLVRQYGEYVFIKLEQSAPRSECSKNGYWDYTLPLDSDYGKAIYTTLLAAYMAKKSVTITGVSNGTCNEFGSVESMNSLNLK